MQRQLIIVVLVFTLLTVSLTEINAEPRKEYSLSRIVNHLS